MRKAFIILLGLAVLASATTRSSHAARTSWFHQLRGSQKLFGVIAAVLALLIVMNPEFLALGLLGDTTFFDMLVLAMSLQLHLYVTRAFRRLVAVLSKTIRWLGIPSPGFRYTVAMASVLVTGVVATAQRAFNRWFS